MFCEWARSARACEWVNERGTEAPFTCLDPRARFVPLRNVLCFFMWSPKHSFVRVNAVDVEIPEGDEPVC